MHNNKLDAKYFNNLGKGHFPVADTIAGYSSIAHLPENGKSFTTLELKCNFIKAIREGKMKCACVAEHLGRTTHVWRVIVSNMESEKKIALFSCTQLILY